ncbi:[FeFe] hydrogenase H-cluster maturation GTPase HydF [Shewanella sp. JM162201]|uniref:[FeFe] hydrogenase H-cluster maturation GTPase HydF n=1 Tax=Shewanella jiangmenensis TaxID=2837387 RepID=A0ABS5V4V4_9GAMM|nr:[FeFe] hydrogenase H-cluster maturation GTPase HydF [Shewanella jiangmenensis]MBT1444836.1 [FeFe] hydrogenase H-cluster maturation GTPase HydF [Shewanella jiangmenensis]
MCQGIEPGVQPIATGQSAPRGMRAVIALFGRTNTGKSSLLNALTGQRSAIVSAVKGTTTDAVAKGYELLPLGPVTFYDTAGLDDDSPLGAQRVKATRRIMFRADMGLVVVDDSGLGEHEYRLIDELKALNMAVIVVFNKADISAPRPKDLAFCRERQLPYCAMSATNSTESCNKERNAQGAATNSGIGELKRLLIEQAPTQLSETPLLAADLYRRGDSIICVAPIDKAAPKGRLILPQVQVLREALDKGALATLVQDSELHRALELARLAGTAPALVITDAQAIVKVAKEVADNIPLTTFSTLFARQKGCLATLERGALKLDALKDNDRVLIAEGCSHNVQEDDIGRVKLPKWIESYSGKQLSFEVCAGHDFPDDLERYALVVHCGACMLGRAEMLRRIRECERRAVPITNYGIAIAKLQGVLERVTRPFRATSPA